MTTTRSPRDLGDLLDGFHSAIDEEIEAIQDDLVRRGLDRPLAAAGGHEAASDAMGFSYDWSLPPGRYVIRPEDAVRVSCEAGESLGFVTAFDAGTGGLRLTVPDWLGRHPGAADLRFDPTWLLGVLTARLGAVAEAPDEYHVETALRLFGRRFPETGIRDPAAQFTDGLNASQSEALGRVLGSGTQLIWGPPGTGKTRLLAQAGCALAAEGTVLVLATTNAAVDDAARRIANGLGESSVRDGRLVRVGAALSPTGDADLSIEAAIERNEVRSPSRLSRLLEELESELVRGRQGSERRALRARFSRVIAAAREAPSTGAMTRVGHIALEFQRAGSRVLTGAAVVLTTFARLTLRDDLWNLRFASLLVDEASTTPLPYVFAGACLASRRAVAVGDFQQLPAVVMSRGEQADRWLSRDIFHESGVIDPARGLDLPDPRDGLCAMLREQYRMAPPIRELVGDLFYGGRLQDAPELGTRKAGGPPLVLADTAVLSPTVQRLEGSRANERHVEVVLQLVEIFGRHGVADVGIVTPYRLQARRIQSAVRNRLGRTAPSDLEVATIHRFQGREKSVVILDTVDAPPGGSWFLNEIRNPAFPRLLNVALSRSRDSLVVVGTYAGLTRTLPAGSLLLAVLDRIRDTGKVLDAGVLARGAASLFSE